MPAQGLLSSDEFEQVIYVADAACVTPDNLWRFAALGVSFVSRLPAWSTHLEQRKEHSVQRQADRERKDVEAAQAVLGKTVFNCHTDAEREAPVEITTYRVQVELGELQSDLLQARRDEESLFILVTNLLDAQTHPPEAILREYKEQSSVEVRFRFLKDPAFVDGFFVKDKGRLEALAYLIVVALLMYALIERLVRMGLREQKRSLIGVGGVKHEEPTGRVILAILATIHVLLIRTPLGIER